MATLARAALLYAVYEWSAFGSLRIVAELEATSDAAALAEARRRMPHLTGELRQGARVVCRFGRS